MGKRGIGGLPLDFYEISKLRLSFTPAKWNHDVNPFSRTSWPPSWWSLIAKIRPYNLDSCHPQKEPKAPKIKCLVLRWLDPAEVVYEMGRSLGSSHTSWKGMTGALGLFKFLSKIVISYCICFLNDPSLEKWCFGKMFFLSKGPVFSGEPAVKKTGVKPWRVWNHSRFFFYCIYKNPEENIPKVLVSEIQLSYDRWAPTNRYKWRYGMGPL